MSLSYWFTKLSYWNDTTCIRSNNLDLIEQSLTRIFERKGCRRIPKPPLPPNSLPVIKHLHSCAWDIEPYLWVIGLFIGNCGWTIVKTSPNKLLCCRARDAIRPKLSELAMQISCDAFHHSVHDRYWGALLEANATGEIFASGYLDCDDKERMSFYGEAIIEQTVGSRFFLINVPEELQTAIRADRVRISDEERQTRHKELEALFEQGGDQVANAWSEWEELNQGAFESADKALGQVLSSSSQYWYLNNLLHQVYAEPQQLEADGVRLLYFKPASSDQEFEAGEIWEAINRKINISAESGLDDDIPF